MSLLGWRSQEITGWAENDRGVFLIQTGKLQIRSEGYVAKACNFDGTSEPLWPFWLKLF